MYEGTGCRAVLSVAVEILPQTNDGKALVVCFVFSALFAYCSSSIPYVMLKKKINLDAILV